MENNICELDEGTYYIGGEGISETDPEKVLNFSTFCLVLQF